jgi:hypothetical protein
MCEGIRHTKENPCPKKGWWVANIYDMFNPLITELPEDLALAIANKYPNLDFPEKYKELSNEDWWNLINE